MFNYVYHLSVKILDISITIYINLCNIDEDIVLISIVE